MKVSQFSPRQTKTFNEFVSSSAFCNILQSWEWGEVKKSKQWQVERLGVYKDGELLAVAQILRRRLFLGFYLFYCPYGPVLSWDKKSSAEEVLKSLQDYHRKKSGRRALFLKIEPAVSYSSELEKALSQIGFIKTKNSIQPQKTLVLNLKPKLEAIFERFEKDTRYSIRRSEREEVKVKEFENPLNKQPLKEFHNLYKITSKRGKFAARSLKQFEKIWDEMAEKKMVKIFQAWFKDKILAACLVLKFGQRGFLIYAGSIRSKALKNKFPTYLLQWKAIESLKKEGLETYDFWGIAPTDDPQHPWAGHTLFKRGFRGEEIDYLGSFDYPLSSFYRLYALFSHLRYWLNDIRLRRFRIIPRLKRKSESKNSNLSSS